MSAPIAGFQAATPLQATHSWFLQITGPEQGVTIAQVLGAAITAGLITYGAPEIRTDGNGGVAWSLKISSDGSNFTHAAPGDYIVITTEDNGAVTGIQFYNGPSGTYTNPAFADKFQTSGGS